MRIGLTTGSNGWRRKGNCHDGRGTEYVRRDVVEKMVQDAKGKP